MNWQPIGECPIPKQGEAPQRVLLGGVDSDGIFAWTEGAMRWDGATWLMTNRVITVTHFCRVTPPEVK